MRSFTLHLQSAGTCENFENIASFIGADASGSFGIMAGHERMMSILNFGLVKFKTQGGAQHFAALPGGILYFESDALYITTRRYILGDNYEAVTAAVKDELVAEEEAMHDLKGSISRLEEEMTRRLWRLQHGREERRYG